MDPRGRWTEEGLQRAWGSGIGCLQVMAISTRFSQLYSLSVQRSKRSTIICLETTDQ